MRKIKLSNGMVTLVDDEDYELLNQWKWHAHKDGNNYYVRRGEKKNGKYKMYRMHRVVMSAKMGQVVDHINKNSLDNRRSNLRICTHLQNNHNAKMSSANKSGFKGVSFCETNKKYKGSIKYKGKTIHCGYFNCPIEAAKAYDSMAIKYHKEFASTNESLGLFTQSALDTIRKEQGDADKS